MRKEEFGIINSHLTFGNIYISNVTTGIRSEAFNENYFPVVDRQCNIYDR